MNSYLYKTYYYVFSTFVRRFKTVLPNKYRSLVSLINILAQKTNSLYALEHTTNSMSYFCFTDNRVWNGTIDFLLADDVIVPDLTDRYDSSRRCYFLARWRDHPMAVPSSWGGLGLPPARSEVSCIDRERLNGPFDDMTGSRFLVDPVYSLMAFGEGVFTPVFMNMSGFTFATRLGAGCAFWYGCNLERARYLRCIEPYPECVVTLIEDAQDVSVMEGWPLPKHTVRTYFSQDYERPMHSQNYDENGYHNGERELVRFKTIEQSVFCFKKRTFSDAEMIGCGRLSFSGGAYGVDFGFLNCSKFEWNDDVEDLAIRREQISTRELARLERVRFRYFQKINRYHFMLLLLCLKLGAWRADSIRIGISDLGRFIGMIVGCESDLLYNHRCLVQYPARIECYQHLLALEYLDHVDLFIQTGNEECFLEPEDELIANLFME